MCEENMTHDRCTPPRSRPVLAAAVLLGSALVPGPAAALDSDSSQPIYIESNTATYDERKGQTVYVGDVKATQGSLEVYGDQMTVYDKGGKTEKIVVLGNPSRLKQTPEGGKEDIHGTAQRSEYFPETGILILYDKALVWQGQNTTTSDRIEYDIKNGLFKAGSPTSGKQRVHVKLQSQSQPQAPEKPRKR
jgi:lipopolysaccharide export system protein LptA